MWRYILAFILLIHGIIHFMGFVKAFNYSKIPQLTTDISRPMGGIWFGATILFVGVMVMLLFRKEEWWLIGLVAIVVSEALIITAWKDAKFGTIPNVIILIAIIIAYETWSFKDKYRDEVETDLASVEGMPDSILIEADLQYVPDPIRKYIHYSGAVGKPKIKNFKVEFAGKIRKNEQSPWMPFTSEQYNFMDASARLFFMKATMSHLPVAGFHSFNNGNAFMDIRLFSLFRVQYQTGKEMGIAETVTFFNDMCCMAPATLIDKRIKWLDGDDSKVNASFTNNGITVFATLYFNDKGELVNFISDDRYAAGENNAMKQIRWSTPLKDYKEIRDHRVAGNAATIYHYPEGDLCYGTFELINVEYNSRE